MNTKCVSPLGAMLLLFVCVSASALTPPAQSHVLRFGGPGLTPVGPIDFGIDGGLTIELWVRPEKLTEFAQVLVFHNPADQTWLGGVGLPENGRWLLFTERGNVESSVRTDLGRWTHVAGRASSSKLEFFIDGALVGTTPITTPVRISSAILAIGESYVGALRQVRIWKSTLSDADIRKFAEQLPDAADPRIVAWWPMDDASRGGFAPYLLKDKGSKAIDFALTEPRRVRWVRSPVLEAGPFFEARSYGPGSTPVPRLLDFDGDGDLDIYTVEGFWSEDINLGPPWYAGEPPIPDRAFRNDGTGGFVDVSAQVLQGPRIQAYLVNDYFVADFTGDGLPDIMVTDAGPELPPGPQGGNWGWPNSIRVGTPDGKLINESAARLQQKPDYNHRSAIGDINGDGAIDAVSAGEGAPYLGGFYIFYVNDGRGVFRTVSDEVPPELLSGPQIPFRLTSVALIDSDRDGDLDLFAGEIGNYSYNRILANDGTGRFSLTPIDWLPAKIRLPDEPVDCGLGKPAFCRQSITVLGPLDINRDGLDDIVIGVYDGHAEERVRRPTLQILLGNGDGTFREGTGLVPMVWDYPDVHHPDSPQVHALASFDQNGDGWLDLATPQFTQVPARILINHGSSGFEEAGDLLPPGRILEFMDAGDVDRDGDADLIWSSDVLKNQKPYAANAFGRTDLALDMRLTRADSLGQRVTCTNRGTAAAHKLTLSVPVPHGFTWSSTSAGPGTCKLERHVALCSLDTLPAGESWSVQVFSNATASVDPARTFALASITGDVIDGNLTNNVARVRLDQAQEPGRRRSVRK